VDTHRKNLLAKLDVKEYGEPDQARRKSKNSFRHGSVCMIHFAHGQRWRMDKPLIKRAREIEAAKKVKISK